MGLRPLDHPGWCRCPSCAMARLEDPDPYPPHSDHPSDARCDLCEDVNAAGNLEDYRAAAARERWRPDRKLRAIAERHPELEWLALLPLSERVPWARPVWEDELRRRFPGVEEVVWRNLLPA